MNRSLTPNEVKQLFNTMSDGRSSVAVVMYDDIINTDDLSSLFSANDCFVIFYPQVQSDDTTMGHYTCVCKNNETKTLSYYDSLAYKPDEFKKFSPQKSELYREEHNSLVALFLQKLQDYTIDYNTYQHQSRKSNVATCGRHCVFRCLFPELSNAQYNRLLSHLSGAFKLDQEHCIKDRLIYFLTKDYI